MHPPPIRPPAARRRPSPRLPRMPRRTPAVWAATALLTALSWWALLSGLLRQEGTAVLLGTLAGGWGLSLLPVHSNRRRLGPARSRVRGGQRRADRPRPAADAGEGPRWQEGHQ